MVNDPAARGSKRDEKLIKQGNADVEYGASEGPGVDKAPGDEDLGDAEAMDKVERKIEH